MSLNTAFRLGVIAGIPVKVHWSFSLLILWISYIVYRENLGGLEATFFFALVLLLFCCVVAHEYGHALMARRYNVPTRDIFILPIGGLARLEYLPEDPKKEMAIAIAGPLVNLGLALILFLIIFALDGNSGWEKINSIQDLLNLKGLAYAILFLNIMLFFFNLIPAYPMDGGRILRSLLSIRFGKVKATIWASYLAQIIGILFMVYGATGEKFTIALIGVFVFFTSGWERRAVTRPHYVVEHEEEE